jgi:cation diffusion facilitator family transporter
MATGKSSRKVIYAALGGNCLIAVTKFVAAAWTGSSAMLSEGVHSLVDTGNQGLLLYGGHRASRPPDDDHPLGYGRELYFWSFIVALLIFSLGAGISLYEGIGQIRHPAPISDAKVNYIVLGFSMLFEGGSWWIAFREFGKKRGSIGFLKAVIRSKDPTSFIVLFEDSAALIGIAIAFCGTFAAGHWDMPELDGAASVGIGCVLAVTAVFLARESKGLLIGEPARNATCRSILQVAREQDGIRRAAVSLTVHLAPDQIVAALDLGFDEDLSAADVEEAMAILDKRIKARHPEVIAVFVNPRQRPAALKGQGAREATAALGT